MNESILIVEDEDKIARLLEIELGYESYQVTIASDGMSALETYRGGTWDLILLDVMLPGISGIELLRRIRANDRDTPIILLTAKNSIEDKVSGLDLGANDYLTKPFEIEELLARIRACFRVTSRPAYVEVEEGYAFSDLKINELTREVTRGERQIELTPREYDLLTYLVRNKRQVLQRDQIISSVWGYDYSGDTNVVDVYIRYVRKKLNPSGNEPELIHTVRGVGYVLKETL